MARVRAAVSLFLLCLLTLILFLTALSMPATAQDSSPSPTPPFPVETWENPYDEPAEITGAAEWTLTDLQFISNYPNGFEFMSRATSTGGELAAATIIWSHNPRAEQTRRIGEVNAETGTVRAVWDGLGNRVPPWVAVNYRWQLTDRAGNSYRSAWVLGDEYADRTRQWTRGESDYGVVFVQDGMPAETLDLTLRALSETHAVFVEAFGRTLLYKPRIILFADRAAFEEWNSERRGVGGSFAGFTDAFWGGTAQVSGDLHDLVWRLVIHETAHLYQADLYDLRGPAWWIEGSAVFFEVRPYADYSVRVHNMATQGILPPLLVELGPNPYSTGPDGLPWVGYDMGYAFVKWLVETYGIEAHRAIVALFVEGKYATRPADELNLILEEVVGLSPTEIEMRWRVWLGASAQIPTLIPTPTLQFRFPATATPRP